MPTPPDDESLRCALAALNAGRAQAWLSLTDEQRAVLIANRTSKREGRAQGRSRARERRAAALQRAARINDLIVNKDASAANVADAEGISERALGKFARRWGIVLPRKPNHRRMSVWMLEKYSDALNQLAFDMERERPSALMELLAALLADDAHIARRVLHVKRRASPPLPA